MWVSTPKTINTNALLGVPSKWRFQNGLCQQKPFQLNYVSFLFSQNKNREKKLIPKNEIFSICSRFCIFFWGPYYFLKFFDIPKSLRKMYLLWNTTNNLSNVGKRRFSEKTTNLRQVFEFGRVNYRGQKIFCRDVKTGFYVSRATFCECFWKNYWWMEIFSSSLSKNFSDFKQKKLRMGKNYSVGLTTLHSTCPKKHFGDFLF